MRAERDVVVVRNNARRSTGTTSAWRGVGTPIKAEANVKEERLVKQALYIMIVEVGGVMRAARTRETGRRGVTFVGRRKGRSSVEASAAASFSLDFHLRRKIYFFTMLTSHQSVNPPSASSVQRQHSGMKSIFDLRNLMPPAGGRTL
jgi:hypothetical protein